MPTTVHEFAWPDRLVVGAVGRPGSRTFYLQVRERAQILTIALEKEQSAALAVGIDKALDELRATEGNPYSIPDTTPVELVDDDPLEEPLDPRFRTAVLSLGWDPSRAQVVIEAYPLEEVDDPPAGGYEFDADVPEPSEVLVVQIPVGAARAFAKRTLEVVGAGRPLCALCGTPLDPEGHVCPAPGDDE